MNKNVEKCFLISTNKTIEILNFRFLDYVNSLPDTWMVSMDRALEWMKNPTSLDDIYNFKPFKCNPTLPDSNCLDQVDCKYTNVLDLDEIHMKICGKRCPKTLPWLGNVDGAL